MAFEGVSAEYQIKLLSTVRAVRKEELADEFQKNGIEKEIDQDTESDVKKT